MSLVLISALVFGVIAFVSLLLMAWAKRHSLGFRRNSLVLSYHVSNQTPGVGESITFELSLLNKGKTTARGIQVTNQHAGVVNVVSALASQGRYDADSGMWELDALESGDGATLTIAATVSGDVIDETLFNTASVTSLEDRDAVRITNPSKVPITVRGAVEGSGTLEIEKPSPTDTIDDEEREPSAEAAPDDGNDSPMSLIFSVEPQSPHEGDFLIYSLVLSNSGPGDIEGTEVVVVIPEGIASRSASTTHGSYNSTSRMVGVWDVGKLEVDEISTLIFHAGLEIGTAGSVLTATAFIANQPLSPELAKTATVTVQSR